MASAGCSTATDRAASVIVEGGGFASSEGDGRPDMQIHAASAMVVRGGQTQLEGHRFTMNTTLPCR
jgi:choline dehydrogenase